MRCSAGSLKRKASNRGDRDQVQLLPAVQHEGLKRVRKFLPGVFLPPQ